MQKFLLSCSLMIMVSFCFNNCKQNSGYSLAENPEFGDKLIIDKENVSFYRYVGAKNEKKILQKGVILKYHTLDNEIKKVYSWGSSEVVPSSIVKYGEDNTFILVEQKSLDDAFGKLRSIGDELIRDKAPKSVIEMRRMVNDCNCSKYWIINKTTDEIYGPFNLNEFMKKRIEIGVSNKIILLDNNNI